MNESERRWVGDNSQLKSFSSEELPFESCSVFPLAAREIWEFKRTWRMFPSPIAQASLIPADRRLREFWSVAESSRVFAASPMRLIASAAMPRMEMNTRKTTSDSADACARAPVRP